MNTETTPLLRISAAARIAGLTARVFRDSLSTREIPIAVVQLGKLRFVRAGDLAAWLSSAPAQASANLFK